MSKNVKICIDQDKIDLEFHKRRIFLIPILDYKRANKTNINK